MAWNAVVVVEVVGRGGVWEMLGEPGRQDYSWAGWAGGEGEERSIGFCSQPTLGGYQATFTAFYFVHPLPLFSQSPFPLSSHRQPSQYI